jgi:hypothetical protein
VVGGEEAAVTFLAWMVAILAAASIVLGPFMIGKDRPPLEPPGYVAQLMLSAMSLAVAGRVLGWW